MEALFSRKLWVAIATAVTIALEEKWGLSLDPEALLGLALVAAAYIGGQAHVDKNKVVSELDAQKALLSQRVIDLTNLLKSIEATEAKVN